MAFESSLIEKTEGGLFLRYGSFCEETVYVPVKIPRDHIDFSAYLSPFAVSRFGLFSH